MKRLALIAVLLSCVACTLASSSYTEDRMNALASSLTKLSSVVDGAVRFSLNPRPSPLLDDEHFLKLTTANNPRVLEPFSKLRVRVKRENLETIILVCKPDANEALLEDATCTSRMEEHRWKDQPPSSCEFTLNLAAVCQ